MKTLKQILGNDWILCGVDLSNDIIERVKKWLQQKQKDEYKNWHKELNETLRIIYRAKNIMLNEFLEELENNEM